MKAMYEFCKLTAIYILCCGIGLGSTRLALEVDRVVFESRLYKFRIEAEHDESARLGKLVVTSKKQKIDVPREMYKDCGEIYLESMKVVGVGSPNAVQTQNFSGAVEIIFEMEPTQFHKNDKGEEIEVRSSVRFSFESEKLVSVERCVSKGDGRNSWEWYVKKIGGKQIEHLEEVKGVENPMTSVTANR